MGSRRSLIGAGILGRDSEIDRVRGALDTVAGGWGRGLLITGEAGIGKSRLLDMALCDACDQFRVVAEAASEVETDLPFAPLIRGLGLRPDSSDAAAAALGQMLARPDVADPDLLRLQVIEGITDLVERWARDQPVLLAVDDLHWADDATLQSLDRATRRARHVGVLVAGTARPYPRRAGLRALERTFAEADAVTVELTPLPDEVIDELARQVVGAEPGPRLAAALHRAGGNPLYVEELVAAAGAQESGAGHVAELPPGSMSSPVRQAILRNLSSLCGPTLDVLRTAAVLGTRFDLRQLALALDRNEAEVIDLLRPALASGVVTGSGDFLSFRHDLVREAVYEDQPDAVRAASHRHVVERLRAAHVSIEDLVPHLLRGRWGSVPEAATWLADAGRAMRSRHLPVAGELLARALELSGDGTSPDLRLEYAAVLAASNRPDDLAAVLKPLLSAPPEALPQATRDRLVRFAGSRGNEATATNVAARRNLLDTLEAAGLSEAGAIRAMVVRAEAHWFEGRQAEAEELATRALAAEAIDPVLASQLEVLLARLAEGRGDMALKRAHGRRALVFARDAPAEPEVALNAAATFATMLGTDPSAQTEVDEVIAEAQALADRTGLESHQPVLEAVAALNADCQGAWEEAAASYESAMTSVHNLDAVPASAAQLYACAARLHVHRDDLPLATKRLLSAQYVASRARAQAEEPAELSYVHVAEAEVGLALGDTAAASDGLRALASFVDARGVGTYHVTMLPAVTAVAMGLDDPRQARRAVAQAERWMAASDHSDRDLEGVVRWCRAFVDGVDAPFEQLISWADELRPMWEWKPRIREDAARVFVAAGRHDDAVERLQEALALWGGVGARRDVARVRRCLRDLGVRSGRGPGADRPSAGWPSLTDAKWRVLEFVGEGLIYREIGERLFVSPRTVETHVQHVFHKLGVSSRRDLVRLLQADEGRRHLAARVSGMNT